MGKGDKRTRRGKIFKGSFGNSRPRKVKKKTSAAPKKALTKKEPKPLVESTETKTQKRAPAKKSAPKKKTAESKPVEKKEEASE